MIWIIPQHDILMFASNKYLITEFGKDLLGLCGPERENMSKNGDDPFLTFGSISNRRSINLSVSIP